ncbi:MAG: apolipoprotein N-acyltransferase [Pseudomonadota bacterium]
MADTVAAPARLSGGRWWYLVPVGVTAGAGQVPFGFELLGGFGFFLACWLMMHATTVRRAFWSGWAFGLGYFGLTLHWIVEPFLVDIARHGWMAPFALFFTATGFALFWGVAAGAARWIAAGPWGFALAWAGAMGLVELARGKILTGFPWALPGYQWVDMSAVYLSAWIGPFGLTLLTVALPALAAAFVAGREERGAIALGVAPPLAILGVGILIAPPELPEAEGPLVRLIQPNAPQHLKWHPDHVMSFYERQVEYTAASGDPALIVWPETAIPWRLANAEPAFAQISTAAGDATVVLGLQRTEGEVWHNSLVALDAGGAQMALYDKHHLVPFGEYMPLGGLLRQVGITGLAENIGGGFAAGPGPELIALPGLGVGLPLICYEAIFPRNIRGTERPDFLIHITNDAWFGERVGPQQHLAQARMRAVEFGLPVMRAANTGISAMIDAQGRVTHSLDLGVAGYIDAPLPPAGPETVYARIGDGPAGAAGLLLLLFGAMMRRLESD